MNYETVSLVIIGYDPYKDVWDHYFELLNRYWSDRPATYLITNEITPEYAGVQAIAAGKDAEWSKKVQVALEQVQTKYFVLLLEDFFTTRPVNGQNFCDLMSLIEENDIQYCKLLNQSKIKGKRFADRKSLHIINRDEEYGISLQPAIWNRDYLRETVGSENYNAWIFEFNQIKDRKQNRDRIDCLADDSNILEITHAVVQSKYLPSAVKVFKKQGYPLNTQARAVFSGKENFKYRFKQFVKHHTPKFMHKGLKKVGRKMNVDFVSDRQLGGKK